MIDATRLHLRERFPGHVVSLEQCCDDSRAPAAATLRWISDGELTVLLGGFSTLTDTQRLPQIFTQSHTCSCSCFVQVSF